MDRAFKVLRNGKEYDYRVGAPLDIVELKAEFSREFEILDIKQANRHVIATVRKEGTEYILKIATSEGISIRSETEKAWNDEFNSASSDPRFKVPENYGDGEYKELYFLVMEKLDGPLICDLEGSRNLIPQCLNQIIDFSEHIQSLSLNIPVNDAVQNPDHRTWFVEKTKTWLDSIPKDAIEEFGVNELFELLKKGAPGLEERTRHGDFTPWHLIVLNEGLGLIDGEHAHSHGVEYYDISYFIQRAHSVLDLPDLALTIFNELLKRSYSKEKLQTVLASRAIGGFLDESLKPDPDYKTAEDFKTWIMKL